MSDPDEWTSATSRSVLFQSEDETIVLLDIPRSLEEGQVLSGHRPQRRVYSDSPPREAFPTPDPKRSRRRHASSSRSRHGAAAAHDWPAQSPAARINDLMTTASVQGALRLLQDTHSGPYHLPRISPPVDQSDGDEDPSSIVAVQDATSLHGSVQDLRNTFHDTAPVFRLIVLDPPWPNRSARRRTTKYATASNLAEMRTLLTSIPVAAHLADNGLVAVWITNKAAIPDFLASPTGGVFASWGVELAAEWTWLKITAAGEPIYDLSSVWRKPWEKILIAKRIGAPTPPRLKSKVIVAAPDVHSRKPSLRGLFAEILGNTRYCGLEIFARNLTAGWWSWGDEVLYFQNKLYWTPE
ncbi:hypothetical protein EsDP_00005503 [Epichloe bromicola]|uniref:MT-A70 family n=1 Tax=Epichloe bromicola TaxID=79588 RepID=A0ABQ0CVA3_9HYPO